MYLCLRILLNSACSRVAEIIEQDAAYVVWYF